MKDTVEKPVIVKDVTEIKSQLRKIRDQVNHLLDVLDYDRPKPVQSSNNEESK